ncbi:tripartite tricarboxylate transporter TctB family protein [Hoeflea alexandrii]|uniref:tripartite tricarboxylate transporter TctB family protein n=1 Tax=Hoeflea alexandrii TaxID=288436 RepID=UPI0022AF4A36|nr:tripartite tricarboxylate transporter TctB family protein [Hoeflea alexandrii]MCC0036779.1 tripartite tricarboxylate transporter TctB family protein [Hoeflea sp.]MCZ4290295.1 tripartite tricarboxylate transporter TctB family protein [Hoeflea alexandrii]
MSDRIMGGVGLLLAAFFIWQATLIQESFISDPVGPKIFPIIIGGLVGLSSLAIFLKPDDEPEWPDFSRLFEVGLTVAVMVAYAYALPSAGFVVSTAVAAGYLSWRLGTPPVKAAVAGAVIAIGIYVVFHLILGLSLARGPWGF